MPPKPYDPVPSATESSDDRPGWAVLHLWQIQWVRDLLVGVGLVLLLFAGHSARIVTVPFLLAVLFAYLFEPFVSRITRSGKFSRQLTVSGLLIALTVGVVVPMLLGVGFGAIQGTRLAGTVAKQVSAVIESVDAPENAKLEARVARGPWRSIRDFIVEVRTEADAIERERKAQSDAALLPEEEGAAPETSTAGTETLSETEDSSDDSAVAAELRERLPFILGIDSRDIARALDSILEWVQSNARNIAGQAISTGAGAVNVAIATAGSLGRFLFGAFLTAFFFFYTSTRWEGVKSFARGLLPVRNRERAVEITGKMDHAISGFIRGRLTIAFLLSIFYTVGFALIGVPAPLIMGPALALLAIFPYATLLGLPFVIAMLWLEPHAGLYGSIWWVLLAPIVVYQIGQALDDYVLTPAIQGDATGLDTPTILFASVAGAALLGFFGMLVAIPLAACIKILIQETFWPRFQAWAQGREADFLPIEED